MDGTNMPISSLLEQAAYVVRRKKETTGTLGETESHKRGQIGALISFANENQLWFSCMDYADEFHNDEYEIFDAVPNNVLYGIDGDLYFIDTQIRLKEDFEWL